MFTQSFCLLFLVLALSHGIPLQRELITDEVETRQGVASATGALLGTSLGTAVGSAVPLGPIGPAVGGVVGGIIGAAVGNATAQAFNTLQNDDLLMSRADIQLPLKTYVVNVPDFGPYVIMVKEAPMKVNGPSSNEDEAIRSDVKTTVLSPKNVIHTSQGATFLPLSAANFIESVDF